MTGWITGMQLIQFHPVPFVAPLLQAGTKSPILEWEKQYLLDNGVPPNAELSEVVAAISYFQ